MLTSHIIGGSIWLPDGNLFQNLDYLASGANFHSQLTALTTLGSVAAVESGIENDESRSMMASDGLKLSYLLPQSTARKEYRSLPASLTHEMEDSVRVLKFQKDSKELVENILYRPDFEMNTEEQEGLADGQGYLRGFELIKQPIKFLGLTMTQLHMSHFARVPTGTTVGDEGSLFDRDGSPLMCFQLQPERVLQMILSTQCVPNV